MTWPHQTKAMDIEGPIGSSGLWQTLHEPWSFSVGSKPVFLPPRQDGQAEEQTSRASPNRNGHDLFPTRGVQRITPPKTRPVARPETRHGKRGLRAAYQWEGIVDAITDDGFRARLIPYEDGKPNRAKVEYTDFYFDDLANESDRDLVAPGAVFYWTIGKARNRAGTVTNSSLLRFRRIPSPSSYQKRRAARLAAEILNDADEG